MKVDLTAIRSEYQRGGLLERDLDPSPMRQLDKWMSEAVAAAHPEPTAMVFATVNAAGEPEARVLLIRGIEERGVVFYTNYESDKGRELAANPHASANIFWIHLERQVRVSGVVEKITRAESEAYFASRPRGSQLGAWASAQSSVLAGREELERRLADVEEKFGDGEVPCPPFWGGYCLAPTKIEFWQGRPSRLHDRLRYARTSPDRWTIERLSP